MDSHSLCIKPIVILQMSTLMNQELYAAIVFIMGEWSEEKKQMGNAQKSLKFKSR